MKGISHLLFKYKIMIIIKFSQFRLNCYMSGSDFNFFRDLPLKTKKDRINYRPYRKIMSSNQMKYGLQRMIDTGIKNSSVIDIMRTDLFHEKIMNKKSLGGRRIRSEAEEDIIKKVQEKQFQYFIGKMEISNFKRNIDNVLIKLNEKCVSEPKIIEKDKTLLNLPNTSPMKTKPSEGLGVQNMRQHSKRKRKQSRRFDSREQSYANKYLVEDKNNKRKRTNTFIFNLVTKKSKKSGIIDYDSHKYWQDQLASNINTIQGTQIKNKKNLKVDKEKLSAFLKERFINEVMTTYFKFQASQNFQFLKNSVEELMQASGKQIRLLAFFTYDINQDGFICEEDIYYYISRLPFSSPLLEDFNMIIEFLRKNKLRSNATNIPDKLLKFRHKSQFGTLVDPASSFSKQQIPNKRNSFTEKLFTVSKGLQRQTVHLAQMNNYKKFQINFQVFCLVFAQKNPVLVPEIIYSLIKPLGEENRTFLTEDFRRSNDNSVMEVKEREWSKRMNKTKQILLNFQQENKKLSYKLE